MTKFVKKDQLSSSWYEIDAQNAVAGDGPKVPTMSKSCNKIPILFAIDNRNIHLPFTRSVFNIVDAK